MQRENEKSEQKGYVFCRVNQKDNETSEKRICEGRGRGHRGKKEESQRGKNILAVQPCGGTECWEEGRVME